MYLVDTNVWLERILDQAQSEFGWAGYPSRGIGRTLNKAKRIKPAKQLYGRRRGVCHALCRSRESANLCLSEVPRGAN
jgi:hypothetical protein